jgi:hypothetical protein
MTRFVARIFFLSAADELCAIDSRPLTRIAAKRLASKAQRSDYEVLDVELIALDELESKPPPAGVKFVPRLIGDPILVAIERERTLFDL